MRELLHEYMDFSDVETVKHLSSLNEGNQNQFLVSLTSKLYDRIQEKATKIDFSSIEMSRGDITKIQNYSQMMECLDLIKRIVLEYKENTAPVDVVINAEQNLKNRIRTFKKAFAIGSSLPILTYNTIALSIVEATSFMISVCVEYVKDPTADTFQMALDITAYNKTRQNLLFNTLEEFNKACANKQLDNALNMVMSQAVANRESAMLKDMKEAKIEKDHPFMTDEEIESGKASIIHDDDKEDIQTEGVIGTILSYAGTKILLWICKIFIPIIRSIVYWHYLHKQKISDYYADQADMLQMNAMNLQYRTDISEEQKKAIFAKQMKIVERFRRRANETSIDYMVAKKGSEKLANEESRKFRSEDIANDYDNTQYASIFEAEMNNDLGDLVFESPFEPATIEDRIESLEEGLFGKKKEEPQHMQMINKDVDDVNKARDQAEEARKKLEELRNRMPKNESVDYDPNDEAEDAEGSEDTGDID